VRRAVAGNETADRTDRLHIDQVDIGNEDQVRRLLATAAPLHHIAVTAADAAGATAPIADFDLGNARAVVDTKLFGPWLVAKHAGPYLAPGGSITFTAGIAAYRPGPGTSMTAAVNGALEALSRALALELAPIRVNVVSPGWTDTPLWDTIAGEGKTERLAGMAARLPAGRVGQPGDVAQAFLSLMRNGFITGTVLHVDGGQRLV
jgi:NAD(P)-dependent dehydrogenase (short-subunit alcohol dehydrogenase family)